MSSPRKRTDSTRRRAARPTPPAACSVSMWKNTASPGSSSQPITRKRSGCSSIGGQLGERAVGEPLRLAVEERPRHVPRPEVRAGDELQRRLPGDGIDREPHRDVQPAVDVVVRQVLVPRRALRRAGSLTSTWSWYRRNGAGAHQLGGDLGGRRLADESTHRFDPLPVAEVLDERAVSAHDSPAWRTATAATGWRRSPPRPARRTRVPNGVADAHRAVAPEVALDLRVSSVTPSSIGMRTPRSAATSDALVAGVDVTDHAHPGIARQHPFELGGGEVAAVGDAHHPGVDRAADADAAAVVDAHPRRPARRVDEGVEQRPVGDRVGAVGHRLGLAVRRRHRAGVEVVAADDDRRRHLAAADHLVEAQPETVTLAVAEPADPRRQPLERHPLAGQRDPAVQRLVVGELLEHGAVGRGDVGRVARQGDPAERTLALAEQRSDVRRQEARDSRRRGRSHRAPPPCAGCCRSRRPRRPCRRRRPSPRSGRPSTAGPGGSARRDRCAPSRPWPPRSGRRERTTAGRGRSSGR